MMMCSVSASPPNLYRALATHDAPLCVDVTVVWRRNIRRAVGDGVLVDVDRHVDQLSDGATISVLLHPGGSKLTGLRGRCFFRMTVSRDPMIVQCLSALRAVLELILLYRPALPDPPRVD